MGKLWFFKQEKIVGLLLKINRFIYSSETLYMVEGSDYIYFYSHAMRSFLQHKLPQSVNCSRLLKTVH